MPKKPLRKHKLQTAFFPPPFLILVGPDEELDQDMLENEMTLVPAFDEPDFATKYAWLHDSRSHGGEVFGAYQWDQEEKEYFPFDYEAILRKWEE